MRDDNSDRPDEDADAIAIVGMAGRFPGAPSVRQFWSNLCEGVDAITHFAEHELEDTFTAEERAAPNFVRARAVIDDVDQFDASFFGMHAGEARLVDPQQRVLLECAWEAIEDAGYDTARYDGTIGVFAGSSPNSYFLNNVAGNRDGLRRFTSTYQVSDYPVLLGAGLDFVATRIAYKLDVRGPCLSLQTACSTSLVAIVQACQSLLCYACDMALAGGVSITLPQKRGYHYQEGGMVSPDGTCRTFDAEANGTVFGSGAGIVLLKRLSDALADGDHIYALIKGSAVNNDGASKVGFTAPSVDGQAAVIVAAQQAAGVDARSISYIECHGTATPLGDPIEIAALTKAFRQQTADRQFCAVGSAKPNVGHLDAAAGVTGLIKATLSLHHRILPGTLHYRAPNPSIDFASSPFFVQAATQPWRQEAGPRRAAVSAFGVGGTNAHVVLQEAPLVTAIPGERSQSLLVLSARGEVALKQACGRLADDLQTHPARPLGAVAHTLQLGRRPFEHRAALVCGATDDAVARLRAMTATGTAVGTLAAASPPPVAFMFPGQGAQYPLMGLDLYREQPEFHRHIDRCAEILRSGFGIDLIALLYPSQRDADSDRRLMETTSAQPAIFAVQYALAQLWMHWGIVPAMMIGHSVGELVAACLAGVFGLEEALGLVAERGRLMQALPGGAMLAVRLPEADLLPLLDAGLDIAAVNGPRLCVVSGPYAAVAALEVTLQQRGDGCRRLHTSHAFHSAMVDPVVAPLAERVAGLALAAPAIPYVSCVSGTWITDTEARSADYWARHCREPVRFAEALATLMAGAASADGRDQPILIEVGPGNTLQTLALQGAAKGRRDRVLASLPDQARETPDLACMLASLGSLWTAGCSPDWAALQDDVPAGRVSLPTYPFQRSRYWIDEPASAPAVTSAAVVPPSLPRMPEIEMQHIVPTSALASPDQVPPGSGTAVDGAHHLAGVVAAVTAIIEDLSGEGIAPEEAGKTFLELGFDSLFLSQVTQRLENRFGLKIKFRQLLGDLATIPALSHFIAGQVAPEPVAAAPAALLVQAPAANDAQARVHAPIAVTVPAQAYDTIPPVPAPGAGLEAILRDQLAAMSQLMGRQLDLLRGQALPAASAPPPAPTPVAATPMPQPGPTVADKPAAAADAAATARFENFGPARTISGTHLDATQQQYIASLTERYVRRTRGSKEYTAAHRATLADPRVAAGFRDIWKEMVYPIVSDRAKGSRIWDVDGNEYIDLVNGFGQTAFGHSPDFVVEAVSRQLEAGFAIGPQADLAGKVAELFCELTGNERATFCNTGSEAVMAAMRIARTVTGRSRVVMFAGSYHGQFDEVLIKGGRSKTTPIATPVAAGIPSGSVGNMVVLDYASPESLQWIRDNASELAAVIVEPVQSRHPALRPVEFLRALREITAASGTCFVFDEVVTGFRVHPGGMQAVFGIRADLATYGKVVGGGLPIGVLAGKAAFMDALDGGDWQYGDDSVPEVAVTFFAGTFVRHPLVLASAQAVLQHIKQAGPGMQQGLEQRTRRMIDDINGFLQQRGLATRLETFASWFYFSFAAESGLASLLYYDLRDAGIHIQEGFPCFLTTAHTDADLSRIAEALKGAVLRAQQAGILPSPEPGAGKPVHRPADRDERPATAFQVPLTEPQTEIWLSAQMGDEASCAFNESVSLTLDGELDVAALEGALADVVDRHDALRAHFDNAGSSLWIEPALPIRLALADGTLGDLIGRDARLPFDLVRGPLLRATLLRQAPTRSVLVLTAHHIVSDGWSINVIVGEMAECYAARREGRPHGLPAPFPFSRYAGDQSIRPAAAVAETDAFWDRSFATPVQPLELPSDRPRPAIKSFRGATERRRIGPDLYRAAKRLGAEHGCTLFVTLLATFQALVGRLADTDEVVVGVPTAGQSALEDEILVGHCVNFLPLRGSWTDGTTVAEHLAATRRVVLDAYDHQDTTLGRIVRRLALPRDPNRLPLAEVQFNLERLGDGLHFSGLDVAVEANAKQFVNFDLFCNIVESVGGLAIECDYNSDLFDGATVARWLGLFETLLEQMTVRAAQPLCTVPMLPEAERRQTLLALNETARDYPREQGVHTLFGMQAARTPEAIAASFGDRTITYGALDRRANQLAHYLRRHIGQDSARVVIMLDRSIDMLVGLLAVLKAGYTYVPVDPRHPRARLQHILRDSEAAGLLVSGPFAVDGQHTFDLVCNPAIDEAAISREPEALPDDRFDAGRLAYIAYTSGSTGLPKGVRVTHRSVVNLLTAMARRPGLTSRDVVPAITTVSFDIAVLELFLPLCVGARTVIVETAEAMDGHALLARMRRCGATLVQATPTTWRMLLESGFKPSPGLRMLAGGEPLPRLLADQLLTGGGELWNMYGPTETTIWSAAHPVVTGTGVITIGGPIDNTSFFIVDRHGQPAPIGVPGELWIGGDGVADGYHKRPELTEEKFVPDRFNPAHPGARLYRTGDLARHRSDGEVELLGRIDLQVKLRGFRIEIGEIEAVLARHALLQASAVVLREEQDMAQLVGCYVEREGHEHSPAQLRALLTPYLPDYMIPTAWVRLPEMPTTANGKLDRKALVSMAGQHQAPAVRLASRTSAPPRTASETLLADIWAEVLKRDQVGVDDDLFDLGADSIHIFQITARANREGLPVAAKDLLRLRTVARICAAYAQEAEADAAAAPVYVKPQLSQFARVRPPGGPDGRSA
ncbi:non-ribosomal peptide synthetase/type I polyketide synthase [Lichenicoccus roseus]|uniref:Amino acid adenylation domain-containing protein n=1 Tax=Lichenicoccus roseus TaxID=2683649 RepID=A0A5R9J9E3_9PROT|nr:non-ribosomal peptide synthetase/type I polyketide synthase [Lichenicoccus roseus]TLU70848.1 amino acid adenylation domain-containing protein [Lichenicoccus roseus]